MHGGTDITASMQYWAPYRTANGEVICGDEYLPHAPLIGKPFSKNKRP